MTSTIMLVQANGSVASPKPLNGINGINGINGGLRVPSSTLSINTKRTFSLENVPEDHEAQLWSEAIKQNRNSRNAQRTGTEDDDKVIVGTKVEEGHTNYEVA